MSPIHVWESSTAYLFPNIVPQLYNPPICSVGAYYLNKSKIHPRELGLARSAVRSGTELEV